MTPPTEKHIEDLKWLANFLGIKYTQATELARQNLIPVVRVGRLYRVQPHKIRAWVEAGGKSWKQNGGWRKERGGSTHLGVN